MIALLLLLGLIGGCHPQVFKDSSHMTAVSGGKPVELLYSDNFLHDSVRTWQTIAHWYLNKSYEMCPPQPLKNRHQRWWFQAFDSGTKNILIHADGKRMLRFVPGVDLNNKGCLVLKNLTENWYGRFLYAPNSRVEARWIFKNPAGFSRPSRPSLVFTPVVANPDQMLTLCLPMEDALQAKSIRWHYVETGKRAQEFAYRYDSSYRWLGYPYSQFTAQNVFRWGHHAIFYTDGCVRTMLRDNTFIFATTASDSAGNNNIRRYIWKGYRSEGEKSNTYPRLGVLGLLKNPNTFYETGPTEYWYLGSSQHMAYSDWEPKIFVNQSWTRGEDITLCSKVHQRRERGVWYFIPWWDSKDYKNAHLVAAIKDPTFTDSRSVWHANPIVSPGIRISGDGHCLTIRSMDNDLAGSWIHFFNKRYWRSTVIDLNPTSDAKPPTDTYRQTAVSLGQRDVWLCPRRDGQMTWTEIKITLSDPLVNNEVLIFHRYIDWKTHPHNHWLNGYMSFEYRVRYAHHPDQTACVVIKEINWETLGIYRISFRHVQGRSWTETVDFVSNSMPTISPPDSTTTLPTTIAPEITTATPEVSTTTIAPETTIALRDPTTPPSNFEYNVEDSQELDNNPPDQGYVTVYPDGREEDEEDELYSQGRSRRRRSLCDGCRSTNWAFNTKYIHLHKSVALQGERREGCYLTWVSPEGTPMVTIDLNDTLNWYAPKGSRWHSDNYLVNTETGNMHIKDFKREDQGVWKGLLSCQETKRSRSIITRLVLVNTIEHIKADMFASVNFSIPMDAEEASVRVSVNGHKPDCLLPPKRCRFNPNSQAFELNFFMPGDDGVWVFEHQTPGQEPFVKVYTLRTNTPEGCVDIKKADQGLMIVGLHPNLFQQRPIKVLWFRQDSEEGTVLTPVARMEGGYQKEKMVEGVFPFFNGNLWVPPELCGLYWALVYSPGEYHLPMSLHLFRAECEEPAEKDQAYFCPAIASFKNVGELIESPFPSFEMGNHTVVDLLRNPFQNNYKTLCFAHGGHSLWDKAKGVNVSCYFDGSYTVNRNRDCGHHLTLAFEKGGKPSTARLLRNYISCGPRRNRRDVVALRTSGKALEVFFETGIYVNSTDALDSLLNLTDHHLKRMAATLANLSSHLSQRRAIPPITEAAVTPDALHQDSPPLVVFPISNFNSSSSFIVLASLLILCLFFTLWLLCKWKKQKRDLQLARRFSEHNPEYAELIKNPIYNPEK
uniref:E3 protein n=1 Tax=Pipistrellus pipistrellus adenovirus TaxID=3140007 RepID=A0AAU6S552_9ADEN